MEMPAVSVIVPVYNGEKYLPDCLESLSAQTFGDVETILVDDGSEDRSFEICERYAGTRANVKIVSDGVNRGAAAARNAGLDVAEGKYVCFVDSDDRVDERLLSVMYEEAERFGADIVQCGYTAGKGGDRRTVDLRGVGRKTVDRRDGGGRAGCRKGGFYPPGKAVGKYLRFSRVNGYIGGKLIRRRSMGEARFDTSLRVGEDGVFLLRLLAGGCSVRWIGEPLYDYRIREDSLSSKKAFSEKIFDNFLQADRARNLCLEAGVRERYIRAFSFVLYHRVAWDLRRYGRTGDYPEEYGRAVRGLGRTWKAALVWGKLTTKVKSILCLRWIGGM